MLRITTIKSKTVRRSNLVVEVKPETIEEVFELTRQYLDTNVISVKT